MLSPQKGCVLRNNHLDFLNRAFQTRLGIVQISLANTSVLGHVHNRLLVPETPSILANAVNASVLGMVAV